MINRRTAVACSGLALAALTLVGCGKQTDDRVADSTAAATAASEAATPAATDAAAETVVPYISDNCQTKAQTPVETPNGSTTLGAFTVAIDDAGIPEITTQSQQPEATELGSVDIVEGTGDPVQAGQTITVDYCGVQQSTAQVIDSSWANGAPATFPLDGLIAGWQQGIPGMKVGGTRLLVIPSELAYQEGTLAFVITLRSIG